MSSKVMGLMPGKWGFLQGGLTPLSHPTTPTTAPKHKSSASLDSGPYPVLSTRVIQLSKGLTVLEDGGRRAKGVVSGKWMNALVGAHRIRAICPTCRGKDLQPGTQERGTSQAE